MQNLVNSTSQIKEKRSTQTSTAATWRQKTFPQMNWKQNIETNEMHLIKKKVFDKKKQKYEKGYIK